MKKNLLVLAALAFLAIIAASPVQAQVSWTDQIAHTMCTRPWDTQDPVQLSWCHGVVADASGRYIQGYNDLAVAPRRASAFGRIINPLPYGYGIPGGRYGHIGRSPYDTQAWRDYANLPQYAGSYGYGGYGFWGQPRDRRPATCVKDTLNALKKTAKRAPTQAEFDKALAFCSGQPIPETQSQVAEAPQAKTEPVVTVTNSSGYHVLVCADGQSCSTTYIWRNGQTLAFPGEPVIRFPGEANCKKNFTSADRGVALICGT